jgi:gas vesicle protein
MSKTNNTLIALLAGAAVGTAIGYLLATDKEKRQEDMEKVKKGLNNLAEKLGKKVEDSLEENIYHS